jgi:hypothetical protein
VLLRLVTIVKVTIVELTWIVTVLSQYSLQGQHTSGFSEKSHQKILPIVPVIEISRL